MLYLNLRINKPHSVLDRRSKLCELRLSEVKATQTFPQTSLFEFLVQDTDVNVTAGFDAYIFILNIIKEKMGINTNTAILIIPELKVVCESLLTFSSTFLTI